MSRCAYRFIDRAGESRFVLNLPGRKLWIAGFALVAALSAVHLWRSTGWIGHSAFLAATVGAAAVAWTVAVRRSGATRVWLAIAVSASALGDLVFQAYVSFGHTEPDVSFADALWIGSYAGVSLAMLLLLRGNKKRVDIAVDGLIDMAVIVVVACLVLWEFWLSKTFTDGSVPLLVRCVWAVYPIMDVVLLALVIRILVERRANATMGVLLGAGAACWLLADFWFMVLVPDAFVSALLDVGWMVGAALFAAACWFDPRPVTVAATDETSGNVGKGRIVLAFAPLLVPGLIELIGHVRGADANPIPLLVAAAALTGLAVARAFRLLNLRDEARAQLITSERLYRALAANSSDAVMMLGATGRIINDSPAFAALIGRPGEYLVGRRALDSVSASDDVPQDLFDQALLSPGVVLAGETRIRLPDHSEMWLSTRAVNLLDDEAVRAIVVNLHDITARKQAEEELLHQAFHDSLTELANRALFGDRVEHALRRRIRSGLDPAVIYLDLDGFKNVNDALGHDAGDRVLKEVADRLRAVVRSGDTVARLGGDEFAILVEESGHIEVEAEAIADRTLQAMTVPIALDDRDVTLSASIGIAHGDAASTASSLLRDADVAMYRAKTTGKARWVRHDSTMRASAIERLQLENEMARAIADDQLRLVYQPVVELKTNRIVGFEALVRWEHPKLGTVMPDQFIPIAEENGLIIPIGRWVLETACRTVADWRKRHTDPLTMAVNLSARQLAASDLITQVTTALHLAQLDPSALVLEMTETALVHDPIQAAAKLHQLRTLGIRLAIDDFGTGYSSLSYLRQFPVDILKIDRSFINTIVDREKVSAIVRGLLDLGRTLKLETVAEGIESDAQLGQLRDENCELGQGYLFSHPVPAHEAEKLLGTWASPSELDAVHLASL